MKKIATGTLGIIFIFGSMLFAQQKVGGIRANVRDASPMLGSGGYNMPVRRFRYNAGNLFITGNVTGGKAFRGYVPYSNFTQFQGSLGSSSLSSFERESINLREIRSGYLYGRARPYFNPSSTILPLSARRYAVPGSSMPKESTPSINISSFGTMSGVGLHRNVDVARNNLPVGVRPSDILVPSVAVNVYQPAYSLAGGKAKELNQKSLQAISSKQQENAEKKDSNSPFDSSVSLAEPSPIGTGEGQSTDINQSQKQQKSFSEFLMDQAAQMPVSSGEVPLKPKKEFAESAKRLILESKKQQAGSGNVTSKPTMSAGGKKKEFIVTSLAGESKDLFSRTMRSAQQLLIQGRYLMAYEEYLQAEQIKPKDPLPLFGQVHALVAAGKFRSAAEILYEAISRFPGFIRLRLEGERLIGGKLILRRRINELEDLLIRHPNNKQIQFLLGYLKILAGNREQGEELMRKAG